MQIYCIIHTHRALDVCVVVKSSFYVVFSLTPVSNQCSSATTAQCIINSGTKWRLGFLGPRATLLQKMIEGCSPLINTIPELMEHTKLLTWLFPFSPPSLPRVTVLLPQLFQLWSAAEQAPSQRCSYSRCVLSLGRYPALSN